MLLGMLARLFFFSKDVAVCQNDLSVGMPYPEILLACANASLTLALNRECFSTSVFGAIMLLCV